MTKQPPASREQLSTERDNRRWLTLKDASDVLGIHYTTLRTWADNGEVSVFRTPGGQSALFVGRKRRSVCTSD